MREMKTPSTMIYQIPQVKLLTLREHPAEIKLDAPESVAQFLRPIIADTETEVETVWMLAMNTRNKVLGVQHVGSGTIDSALVHPREIFRAAIVANAAGIILVHTHPSGDVEPSQADIRVTREIKRAGDLLRIKLIDHLILDVVTPSSHWFSFQERGYLWD